MSTKQIFILVGVALLLVGIIIAAPVASDFIGGIMKGYSISGWHWSSDELGKVTIGGIMAGIGVIVFVMGLTRRDENKQ